MESEPKLSCPMVADALAEVAVEDHEDPHAAVAAVVDGKCYLMLLL